MHNPEPMAQLIDALVDVIFTDYLRETAANDADRPDEQKNHVQPKAIKAA